MAATACSKDASTTPTQRPVSPYDRIRTLDVLRGFALLGILVLNIDSFCGPLPLHDVPIGTGQPTFTGWHASLDFAIFSIKWMFFEGKMRTLFSMLFGAGIVLFTKRLEQDGRSARAADLFCRRNMWLLAFGLMHGMLIWEGDILTDYSVIALLLMFPLRHIAARRLIVLGLLIGIIGGGFGVIRAMNVNEVLSADQFRSEGRMALALHRQPTPEQCAALVDAARQKAAAPAALAEAIRLGRLPYLDSLPIRTKAFLDFQLTEVFRDGWIFEIIGSMILGMGLFKGGFFSGALSRRVYALTALIGYGVSLPIVLVGVMQVSAASFSAASAIRWLFLPYTLEVFAGAVANAAVILLLQGSGLFSSVWSALANVGQTAFSNYILTSVVCQFIFGWGPFKLYGSLEYLQQLFVVAAVWAVNLIGSAIWLRAFAYGPLEWVWRSLTYWQRQKIHLVPL